MKFNKAELVALTSLEPQINSVNSLDEAKLFCKKIATEHYENFPVGSILIPKKEREHFFSVYSFSRIADDIADEDYGLENKEKINLLVNFLKNLYLHHQGAFSTNPVLIALKSSIEIKSLPLSLFERLINAFISDSEFKQPQEWEDLYRYCHNSANPIGELVLRITNNFNEQNLSKSDDICTALQLANFWQDLSVDLDRGRIYIPNIILKKYDILKEFLLNKKINANFIKCLDEVYLVTRGLFYRGLDLHKSLNGIRIKKEIKITVLGGLKILEKTEKLGTDIIMKRPKLKKSDYLEIFVRSFL